MFDLLSPRHTPTLPNPAVPTAVAFRDTDGAGLAFARHWTNNRLNSEKKLCFASCPLSWDI